MKIHKRGFTSLLLFFGSLVLFISGAVLYASPKGRVAHWTDWTMFALDKERWESIHVNSSIFILVLIVFHLFFNWKIFGGYVKKKSRFTFNLKAELAVSALLAALIVIGAVLVVPPFSSVMEAKDDIQAHWEDSSPKAPSPHAEEFRIAKLAKTIDLPVEKVIDVLRKEGFEVSDGSVTVRQLADSKGIAPSDVFAAITKHYKNLKKCGGKKGKCRMTEGAEENQ